ncbi:unnamed protein product [Mycena citricolor]|uniref:Ketoreductase (KR) domain-containing protein n=1 Tax=Mycena citricolor TaxID=2018698 RepID=A0AAD2K7C8_9AGAR|nr:unnamed protein product [Mycena citricolor]
MVLKILHHAYNTVSPHLSTASFKSTSTYVSLAAALTALLTIHRLAQGTSTTRDRDLHNRTFLLTGAFTPLGLTVLEELARRGASVVALCDGDPDSDLEPFKELVAAMREVTKNESIYAERCDLRRPEEVHALGKKFAEAELAFGQEQASQPSGGPKPGSANEKRLDGVVFVHEYGTSSATTVQNRMKDADERALGTFLLATVLLPLLLSAPTERDIRIVNVVNRWYSAAIPALARGEPLWAFQSVSSPAAAAPTGIIPIEAARSLRSMILVRHLQRIFDALPAPPLPAPQSTGVGAATVVPNVGKDAKQRSNIVAMSVSPGVSRGESVAPWIGTLLFIFFYPFVFLLTKSATAAAQSVLHVLFLPTPFKILSSMNETASATVEKTEVLKPGSLYAECAVVDLRIPPLPESLFAAADKKTEKSKGDDSKKELEIEDDREMGGEKLGRLVWESYESALSRWEEEEKQRKESEEAADSAKDAGST